MTQSPQGAVYANLKTLRYRAIYIEEIIKAGALAPSSKNRQPWHFVVTTGKAKEEALAAMEQGLHREAQQPFLPESAQYIAGAWNTLAIMRQAPVLIFVVNPLGLDLLTPQNAENRVFEICNTQSIGATVENMSLAAVKNGLGSLWICDIYFAYRELCAWLNCGGELAVAFAFGYAGEAPMPRPRKNFDDIVEWHS